MTKRYDTRSAERDPDDDTPESGPNGRGDDDTPETPLDEPLPAPIVDPPPDDRPRPPLVAQRS